MLLFLLACTPKPAEAPVLAVLPPEPTPAPVVVVVEPLPWEELTLPHANGGLSMSGTRVTLSGGRLWVERQEIVGWREKGLGIPLEAAHLLVDRSEPVNLVVQMVQAARAAGARQVGLGLDSGLVMPVRSGSGPLMLQLTPDAVYVGRGDPPAKVGKDPATVLQILHQQTPGPVVLRVDDGIAIQEAIPLWETLRNAGWDAYLSSGPAQSHTPRPVATVTDYKSAKAVSVTPDGTFQIDKMRITIDHIDAFTQQCINGSCATYAILESGEQWYVGRFPERLDEDPAWIFQRPVSPWTGSLPKKEPKVTGTLSSLVGLPPAPPSSANSFTAENGSSSGDPLTDAVITCYTAALGRNPACRGQIVITATMASDGRLMGARLSSSALNDATADACILSAVQTYAKGSRSTGITTIQFPFTLSPG